jgi:hypothetical protein
MKPYGILIAVAVLWLLCLGTIIGLRCSGVMSLGGCGVIGDSFGVVNSLFSGLALVFVAYSLREQSREVDASQTQHSEIMALQKEAAELQKAEARISALSAILQTFPAMLERLTNDKEKIAQLMPRGGAEGMKKQNAQIEELKAQIEETMVSFTQILERSRHELEAFLDS